MSRETPDETRSRLQGVLGLAELRVLDGAWSFVESDEPPALERFGVFSFHFPEGVDNSGFVGWHASELKQRLGTGVFVVCGSNRRRGGVYDYWGCPIELLGDALSTVHGLGTGYDTTSR